VRRAHSACALNVRRTYTTKSADGPPHRMWFVHKTTMYPFSQKQMQATCIGWGRALWPPQSTCERTVNSLWSPDLETPGAIATGCPLALARALIAVIEPSRSSSWTADQRGAWRNSTLRTSQRLRSSECRNDIWIQKGDNSRWFSAPG
jgi:hypothetical protein